MKHMTVNYKHIVVNITRKTLITNLYRLPNLISFVLVSIRYVYVIVVLS